MGFFDLFRKGNHSSKPVNADVTSSKEDVFREILEQIAQASPSAQFASGAVFDIVRQQHDNFEQIVRSNNALALRKYFADAYTLFCTNPGIVGFAPAMVNTNNNDTNPAFWNADTFTLDNGEAAALCYMPIQNNTLAARIVGVVLSTQGDRYYYCMLNKKEELFSDVMQNKALEGIEKVGAIRGRGFELMHSFLDCMKKK